MGPREDPVPLVLRNDPGQRRPRSATERGRVVTGGRGPGAREVFRPHLAKGRLPPEVALKVEGEDVLVVTQVGTTDTFPTEWLWTVELDGQTVTSNTAQSFAHLLLIRIGVGVGEAGGSPPSHSMISDIFPQSSHLYS